VGKLLFKELFICLLCERKSTTRRHIVVQLSRGHGQAQQEGPRDDCEDLLCWLQDTALQIQEGRHSDAAGKCGFTFAEIGEGKVTAAIHTMCREGREIW